MQYRYVLKASHPSTGRTEEVCVREVFLTAEQDPVAFIQTQAADVVRRIFTGYEEGLEVWRGYPHIKLARIERVERLWTW